MRIRRKKHLDDRINALSDILFVANYDVPDTRNVVKNYFDFEKMFGNSNNVEIEIGCGKGGYIVKRAKDNPDTNFLAVELIDNVIVMAAENVKNNGLKNVRLFNSGADYLSRYIAPNSISAIYLNFSPPFNGKRYENRRLTKPFLIDNYKEFLKEEGVIELKTDDKDFFYYSFSVLLKKGFYVADLGLKLKNGEVNNYTTEYEEKFMALGLPIYFLRATKRKD